MSETDLDRDDPEQAAAIMRELCHSVAKQRLVLSQLLRSISVAERLAPHSWAVTLFPHGFRLNVGMVEVFTFFGGNVRLFLFGPLSVEAQKYGEVLPCEFRSMPQPQHCFIGSLAEFEKAGPHLQAAHTEFVRVAAVTKNGKPRNTSYARYHSTGLHTYAQRVVAQTNAGA